jgi:transcriptional regulator with XRE-family HTH domain/quercetin dioxygenase-like cupin family protein
VSTSADALAPGGDPAPNLGSRLRQARLDANLSLREMARQLGVSASFVSQLENGKSQPSVATLYSLAQLLGVSIDRLFEVQDPSPAVAPPPKKRPAAVEARTPPAGDTGDEPAPVSRVDLGSPASAWEKRPEDRARLSLTTPGSRTRLVMDSGVIWEQLARNTDQHLDFMEITYPPGSSSTTDDRMLRHDGYEYGYLFEGELQVTLGFDEFTLRAGEAMGLDSSVPHLFKNLGAVPARGVWFVHHRHD